MTDRYIVPAMSMTNAEDRRPPEQHERAVILEADHVEALRQAATDAVDAEFEPREALERRAYAAGQRDALAGAVQRVEAISADDLDKVNPLRERILLSTFLVTQRAVIAAIKGES